ncbi:MAG: hypothetical protein ACLUFM_01905 [Lachnospiraceae bacterium]
MKSQCALPPSVEDRHPRSGDTEVYITETETETGDDTDHRTSGLQQAPGNHHQGSRNDDKGAGDHRKSTWGNDQSAGDYNDKGARDYYADAAGVRVQAGGDHRQRGRKRGAGMTEEKAY